MTFCNWLNPSPLDRFYKWLVTGFRLFGFGFFFNEHFPIIFPWRLQGLEKLNVMVAMERVLVAFSWVCSYKLESGVQHCQSVQHDFSRQFSATWGAWTSCCPRWGNEPSHQVIISVWCRLTMNFSSPNYQIDKCCSLLVKTLNFGALTLVVKLICALQIKGALLLPLLQWNGFTPSVVTQNYLQSSSQSSHVSLAETLWLLYFLKQSTVFILFLWY